MKKSLAFVLLFGIVLLAASCKRNVKHGKGPATTVTRTVAAFTDVEVSAPVTAMIKVEPGATPGIQLSGYANILEDIKTDVVNGKLIIDKDELIHFDLDKDVVATITVPSLNSLSIKGAADAEIQGTIQNDFNLKVSGAGDITIASVTAQHFTATLTGAGSLAVNGGAVNTASYKVSGAGDVEAFPLQAKVVKAKVSGAGDIQLTATEKLDVTINGAGEVSYKGHPTTTSDINGVGSLEDAN